MQSLREWSAKRCSEYAGFQILRMTRAATFLMDRTVENAPELQQAPPSPALLDHLLSQARIDTFVCSLQKHENGYTLAPRIIDDYNFIFLRRGRVVWIIDTESLEMKPGDLVLVPPGITHRAFAHTAEVTLGSVHVRATLPDGQDLFELLQPPRIRHVRPSSRLDRYLDAVIGEWDRSDEHQTLRTMPAWGRLITLELFLNDAAGGLLRHRPLDPIVAATLDELARRIDRPTTLADLASRAGYSPQHLNRSFRAALGMTPLRYLTNLRLQRAVALLHENRLTVAAIARKVGIEDEYYFSRLFRRHTGRSPSQYRADADSNSPSPDSKLPLVR